MDNDTIQKELKDRLEIKCRADWIKFSEISEQIKKLLYEKEGGVDFLSEKNDIDFRIQTDEDIIFKIDGSEKYSHKKGSYLHWECKSKNTVGYREIQINDDEPLYLPIYPKFDRIMYEKMLHDLRKELINIYKIEEKGHSFDNDACFPNILERFTRINDFFRKLKKVLNGIRLNPHKTLVEKSCYYELYELESCGEDIVVPLVTANRFIHSKVKIPIISDYFKNKIPERILNKRKEATFDVYENRMLRHFITILDQHLSKFELFINIKIELYADKNHMEAQEQQTKFMNAKYKEIKESCSNYRKELRNFQQMQFFENVGNFEGFKGSTPVLEKEPNYSKFYELYLEYKKNFKQKFDFPGVCLGLEDTPKLYEYWCLLKIMDDILNIEIDLSPMVDKRFGIINIGDNELLYKNQKYQLFFQKNYSGYKEIVSYSGNKKPDISMEILDGNETKEIVIFDPKYRMKIGTGNNPEDNIDNDSINKMHVYKDSIVIKTGEEMKRLIKKAVIVHPNDKLKAEIDFGTKEDFIKSMYLSPIGNDNSKETLEIKTILKGN